MSEEETLQTCNVAYGSLPSAFCSPQACVACQLSLVSVSHKDNAHMLPASHSASEEARVCVITQLRCTRGGQAEMNID